MGTCSTLIYIKCLYFERFLNRCTLSDIQLLLIISSFIGQDQDRMKYTNMIKKKEKKERIKAQKGRARRGHFDPCGVPAQGK